MTILSPTILSPTILPQTQKQRQKQRHKPQKVKVQKQPQKPQQEEKEEEEDIFTICSQITDIINYGIDYLNKNKTEIESRNDSDIILSDYLTKLTNQVKKIDDDFCKGLGQMYKGTLIKDKLSIRKDGGVYRFRYKGKIQLNSICGKISNARTEVTHNMGNVKGKILFDIIDKIYQNNTNKLDIDSECAKGKISIKKFPIFDFSTSYTRNEGTPPLIAKGEVMYISEIEYDRGTIEFRDCEGDKLCNKLVHKLCLTKFDSLITQIREEIFKTLKSKEDELNEIEKLISDTMAKYILVAEL